jgi:DNA-binding response OmpR family regulator
VEKQKRPAGSILVAPSTLASIPARDRREPPHIILVVEDEVLIRMSVAEYLRDCGFQVFEAASGDEAIEILLAWAGNIDVVFSDVQMPGNTDGFALAHWIRANQPDIRVILTSGVSHAASRAEGLCLEGPVVPKPYDHAELLAKIGLLKERSRTESQ